MKGTGGCLLHHLDMKIQEGCGFIYLARSQEPFEEVMSESLYWEPKSCAITDLLLCYYCATTRIVFGLTDDFDIADGQSLQVCVWKPL